MVKDCGLIMEPTGTDASYQNGLAEQPNRTLATIMKAILTNTNIRPEYWSWVIKHAVYLKNRLPHRSTGTTPYFAWTGRKPSTKLLQVFGCPIIVRLPGHRPAKLDHHTASGIFLGYTAMDHNVYYRDIVTGRVKIATHVTFDKAGFTIPTALLSPGLAKLQSLGSKDDWHKEASRERSANAIPKELLSQKEILPTKATPASASYDLHSAEDITIEPEEHALVNTDISFKPPQGTYG
jgi:hypothetical protein